MKKVLIALLFVFISLSLIGCKKQNKADYNKLTEVNLFELVKLMDDGNDILVACINDESSDSDLIKEKLVDFQKTSFNIVYYLDLTNISVFEKDYYVVIFNRDYNDSDLHIINDGKYVSSMSLPLDNAKLKDTIGKKKYYNIDISYFLEEREAYFNDGINALADGYLASAKSNFYAALPYEEAKNILRDEKMLNLVNDWEYYKKSGDTCVYLDLDMRYTDDSLYMKSYNGKCSKLNIDKLESTKYYYRVDEEYIYTKVKQNDDFEINYTIKEIDGDSLTLINKNGKEYKLSLVDEEV